MNEQDKLPKFMLVIVEDDIIRCVKPEQSHISEVFMICLGWLADEYQDLKRVKMIDPIF